MTASICKVSNPYRCAFAATPEYLAMQTVTHLFQPLEDVTKPNLTTAEAAHYLNRRPQTLRGWACNEDGPIRPKRTNGRLDWPTTNVKAIAGVPA